MENAVLLSEAGQLALRDRAHNRAAGGKGSHDVLSFVVTRQSTLDSLVLEYPPFPLAPPTSSHTPRVREERPACTVVSMCYCATAAPLRCG